MNKIQKIHRENMKTGVPEFNIGDTLQVDVRIVEGGKERIQAFTGTVIARNGQGIAQSEVASLRPRSDMIFEQGNIKALLI